MLLPPRAETMTLFPISLGRQKSQTLWSCSFWMRSSIEPPSCPPGHPGVALASILHIPLSAQTQLVQVSSSVLAQHPLGHRLRGRRPLRARRCSLGAWVLLRSVLSVPARGPGAGERGPRALDRRAAVLALSPSRDPDSEKLFI